MVSNNGTEAVDELPLEEVLQTELTEEAYQALSELEGSAVVALSFWDSSLADELDEEQPDDASREVVDIDLYLQGNILLELYGALLYQSAEDDPLAGVDVLEQALVRLVDRGSVLDEVAETVDQGLALIFTAGDETILLITAGAWIIGEWEELPED